MKNVVVARDTGWRNVIQRRDQRARRSRRIVIVDNDLRVTGAIGDEGQITVSKWVASGIADRVENAGQIEHIRCGVEIGDVTGVPGQDIEDKDIVTAAAGQVIR